MGGADRSADGGPPEAHSAVLFVSLAFGWTWAALLVAVAAGGRAGHPLHLIGLLGPVVAVLVTVRRHSPLGYGRRLARRVVDPRGVPVRWWAAVVAVGVVPGVTAALASGGGISLSADLPAAGAVMGAAAFAVGAGFAEEPGWRGVAQDAVAPRFGALAAGGALGVLWSAWHLPLYLLEGTYQAGLGIGGGAFWASMLVRVPLAVLLVVLVTGTSGLVVTAVVAHALGNLTGEVLKESASGLWVQAVVLAATALAVTIMQHRAAAAAEIAPTSAAGGR
jgi:uncharacterized protein